jgi:hypothetical protein
VLKPKRQAKSLLTAISNKLSTMQRETKNLKISPEVHFRLKLQAHQHGLPIMEYADLLLSLAMSENEAWTSLRLQAVQTKRKET